MPDDPSCQAPHAPTGAVPRTCVPFAHVPAVPVVAVPYVPVPVPSGLPVLSVSGVFPDRTGNVDVSQFLSSWAGEFAAAKADKAPPAAAGNLASLDASGNLSDSGATPASIKAAAVAEVVANAPGTMDTLKEIADILGSAQQSGTVLKRILDLESDKVDKVAGKGLSSEDFTAEEKQKLSSLSAQVPADWGQADSTAPDFIKNKPAIPVVPTLAAVATSGSYNDLTDKPTIPAPVSVDATLTTQGAAADAKAVGDTLRGGFTEWEFSGDTQSGVVYTVVIDEDTALSYVSYILYANGLEIGGLTKSSADELSVVFTLQGNKNITATRHLITPTKTSQLTNDGAPDGGGTPYATTAQVAAKQDALSAAQLANIAAVPNKANTSDVNAALAQKADATDLPYRLVEPGEWEFSPATYNGHQITTAWEDSGGGTFGWAIKSNGVTLMNLPFDEDALSFDFDLDGVTYYATRASLPGHLLDRAGNRVVVSGDTTLTLPALEHAGRLRDFLVRLEISGSTVPTITFAAPTGETLTYETDGNEFPVPDEAGGWLYSFTESCVAHKFAVSLKKVNTVAQGGV